jgi:hypothetical protein
MDSTSSATEDCAFGGFSPGTGRYDYEAAPLVWVDCLGNPKVLTLKAELLRQLRRVQLETRKPEMTVEHLAR